MQHGVRLTVSQLDSIRLLFGTSRCQQRQVLPEGGPGLQQTGSGPCTCLSSAAVPAHLLGPGEEVGILLLHVVWNAATQKCLASAASVHLSVIIACDEDGPMFPTSAFAQS